MEETVMYPNLCRWDYRMPNKKAAYNDKTCEQIHVPVLHSDSQLFYRDLESTEQC